MSERKDESPYPRIFQPTGNARPGGVYLVKQDQYAVDDFASIRKMTAHQENGGYYVGLEYYNEPPREYPPSHMGSKAVGVRLDMDEAAALWHSLGEWLAEEAERRGIIREDD